MAKAKDFVASVIKENFESIVIAFIMALVIRCFAIDIYSIPTKSMNPTLVGHKRYGDRIVVTKFFYEFNPISRYEVIVFRFPLNLSKVYIKRLVGLPEEEFMIYKGDIYVRKAGSNDTNFKIARKPQHIQKGIWMSDIVGRSITVGGIEYKIKDARHLLSSKEIFEKYWDEVNLRDYTVSNGKVACSKDVHFITRTAVGEGNANDVKLAMEFEITKGKGSLNCSISNGFGEFRAIFSELANRIRLSLVDGTVREDTFELFKRTDPDRRYFLEFCVYDGVVLIKINGKTAKKIEFFSFKDEIEQIEGGAQVSIFSERVEFNVYYLDVCKDIHYTDGRNIKEGRPIKIPKGCYVFLGDNVSNSHDSRLWRKRIAHLINGKTIIYDIGEMVTNEDEKIRMGLAHYDYVIKADIHGRRWAFNREDVKHEKEEKFIFVKRNLILGKALLIWWPLYRFRVIR